MGIVHMSNAVCCQARCSVSRKLISDSLLVCGRLSDQPEPLHWLSLSMELYLSHVSQGAAITAALGGQASAIISWLVATQQIYGKLTITTTAASGPSLAGNLVSGVEVSLLRIVSQNT